MKKSLFAIAAVTAFAGAAQAQSSVTVYGLLDMGYVGANSRQAAAQTVTKTTTGSIEGGASATSRIGFKGTEDLGGGASAFFTVEMKLEPDQTNATTSATTGNRQTFVGLKKNGLGSAALGAQYTLIHEAAAQSDAAGLNNLVGNLMYSNGTGGATLSKLAVTNSGMYAGQSYTVRQANAAVFKADPIAGITAKAMVVANGKDSSQTNANTGGNTSDQGFGLSLDYKWNKLFLVAAQQNFFAGETSSYASTTPVLFGTAQANSGGTNVRDNQTYLAGTYDFGIVKTYLQYINRKASNAENPNLYSKYTATQIGVSANLTPVIGVFASAGMGKYYAYNATVVNPGANITGMQLGTTYALSKRTNLYALYGQSATSDSAVATTGTTAAVSSYNQNNYAVGVKHTF